MFVPHVRSEPSRPKNNRWLKFRIVARQTLDQFPIFKEPILRGWRGLKYFGLRARWQTTAWLGHWTHTLDRYLDADRVCQVAPNTLVYCSLVEFNLQNHKGQVIGGDWDKLEKRFDQLDVAVAFKQVCLEGKPWADTVFYQRMVADIQRGRVLWGCRTQADFDRRCQNLELLFHTIAANGFKSQRELLAAEPALHPVQASEITVSIGRDGDLLFSEGAHRLAIAQTLNLPVVPVEIAVRHPAWMKFRRELEAFAYNNGGKLYQPVLHPDLENLPASHSCQDRFEAICAHITTPPGRLLDIGANFGYFCHRFEDLGWECYAVEYLDEIFYFLDKLKRASNKNFQTIRASALDCPALQQTSFNVVLALNIFHHFIKTPEEHARFVEFLHNLQVNELYFEPHKPEEEQMQNAYRNYAPEEFVDFLLKHTRLTQATHIHCANDGRPLYKLAAAGTERTYGV